MTETIPETAINLRNGHLKKYLEARLPHIPEDNTEPLTAVEIAEVIERTGSVPAKTKRIYVAGWTKGAFGTCLVYSTDSVYNPQTESFDSLESKLYDSETKTIKSPHVQWLNHFENYTTIDQLK